MLSRYPDPFIRYLAHFHGTRDYFECHEVLEEYWKQQLDSPYANVWLGLIQVAVAMYHQRRGNTNGARKMLDSSIRILTQQLHELGELGIKGDQLLVILQDRQLQLKNNPNGPYASFDLPIRDEQLAQSVQEVLLTEREQFDTSDETNPAILHKHKLRDRTDVIQARKVALNKRGRSVD